MAISLNVSADIRGATRRLNAIQRKVIPRVTVKALNKTGTTIAKEAAKRIKVETALPAKFIKRKMLIRKASKAVYAWSMASLRSTTNIIEWVTASKKNPRAFRRARGVKSKAWGKSKTYRNTFIGKAKNSGKMLVYRRDSSKPSGVAGVHGPSVRANFARILNSLERVAHKRFGVVFKRDLDYELSKVARK